MFQTNFVSKSCYTIDWLHYNRSWQFHEVMSCNVSERTLICTLSIEDFDRLKDQNLSTQDLYQFCVDLAQKLQLSKIYYVHNSTNKASCELAILFDNSNAQRIYKDYFSLELFDWYETVHYIYYV